MTEAPRYPGYDVMAKRDTPSFNDVTREALDRRLAVPREPRFLTHDEFRTLEALCDRILPQPANRTDPVPLAAYVDEKLYRDVLDGYRLADLPPQREAWRKGLAALDRDAQARYGVAFRALTAEDSDALLVDLQKGQLGGDHWGDVPPKAFFDRRIVHDIASAYYAHPTAWNEIGLRRPGEPARLRPHGQEPPRSVGGCRGEAWRGGKGLEGEPACRLIPSQPRAPRTGRAPDVFTEGGWVEMNQHRDADAVDFAIVGTGAGGGTLAARLAEKGFSVVAFDAGPFFRPLEEFASDETEQEKLYWNDRRIVDGTDPLVMGGKNSGKAIGGSTVHFAMVSLRFRPEWFKARTTLGYGKDWPIDWRDMWHYYRQAEEALSISGPVTYPWGPKRPRYPYRPHPMNAAAEVLARGCEAMGMKWTRRRSPPFRRHAARRTLASIVASAASAARPTPSRAR